MNPVPDEARFGLSSSKDTPEAVRAATWTTDGEARSNRAVVEASKSDRDPRGSMVRGVVEAYNRRSTYGCAAMNNSSIEISARASWVKRSLTDRSFRNFNYHPSLRSLRGGLPLLPIA